MSALDARPGCCRSPARGCHEEIGIMAESSEGPADISKPVIISRQAFEAAGQFKPACCGHRGVEPRAYVSVVEAVSKILDVMGRASGDEVVFDISDGRSLRVKVKSGDFVIADVSGRTADQASRKAVAAVMALK